MLLVVTTGILSQNIYNDIISGRYSIHLFNTIALP